MAVSSNEAIEKSLLRDQKFILEQSREELENYLDLLGTDLIELMVENRVINQREADIITAPDNEKEQAHILLNRMSRKSSRQFNLFCSCVDQAGMNELRERLLSISTVSERCIHELQQKLCQYFVDSYSQVDMLSLHDEGHRVRLDQIYVPIKWATYTQTPDGVEKRDLDAYTDIFKETVENIVRILVRGEPMAGKTTFLRKLSFDWAQAIKSTSISDQNELLERYCICLPIVLRLVTKDASLQDTVKQQLDFLSSRDLLTIKWLLDQEPSKVLIVFDGLDEYNLEVSSDITNIIKQIDLKDCCCIVTSRGEGVSKLDKWNTIFQVDSELCGFGNDEIENYVNLFFRYQQTGKELLSLIFDLSGANESSGGKNFAAFDDVFMEDSESSDDEFCADSDHHSGHLYEMACNPGRLGILCLLWKENKSLGTDRSSLYKEYICLLLKLAEERLSSFKDAKQISIDKLSSHHQALVSFGKLALQRDDRNDMQTVFTSQEVEAAVGPEAMKYGFMFKSHSVSRMRYTQVSFIHKTVQEWLAAYYIYHTEAWNQLVYENGYSFAADLSLHQFIVSFGSNSFEKLLENAALEEGDINFAKYLIFLGKSVNVQFSIGDILARFIHINKWNFYYEKINAAQLKFTAPTDSSLGITQVQELKLCGNALEGAGASLGRLLLHMPACTKLDLNWCGLQAADLKSMVDVLGGNKLAIEELYLRYNALEGAGASLGRLLLLMPACTKLNLSRCDLEAADLESIVEVLGGNTLAIQELSLRSNPLQSGGVRLGRLLLLMPTCTNLDLAWCGLQAADLESMVGVLGGRKLVIQELSLPSNALQSGGVWLGRLLLLMPTCSKLDLGRCGLQAADLESMVGVLRGRKLVMQDLSLEMSHLQGGGVWLAQLLLLMPICTKLNICLCDLEAADLESMVDVLGDTTLAVQMLVLGTWFEGKMNNLLHEAGGSLGRLLLLMPACILLDLRCCGLTPDDLDDMAQAVGNHTLPLEEMRVYGNLFSEDEPALHRLHQRLPSCTYK